MPGQIGITFVINGVVAGLGILTGVLAARLLGVQGRGELAAIQSWPVFLSALAELGIQDGLIYLGSRDKEHDGSIALSATLLILLLASASFAGGWIAMPFLLKAQSAAVVQAGRWYLFFIFAHALSWLPIFLLRCRQQGLLWNLLRLPWPLAWLAVLLGCYAFGARQPEAAAEIFIVAFAVITIPQAIYGLKIAGVGARPSVQYWPPLLRFGLPVFLSTLPQYLTLRIDQLLMAAFLPAKVLGVYVVAVSWTIAMDIVSSAIGAVLFPAIAAIKQPEEQGRLINKALRFGLTGLLVSAAAMALLAMPLIPALFGRPFAKAVPITWVLLLAGIFSGYNQLAEQGLKGLGRTKAVLWAELLGLGATLLMLAFLLMPMQAMGAAVASLIAYAAVSMFLTIWLANAMGKSVAAYLEDLVAISIQGRGGR